tara:strand:- start:235 stop:1545 length:1311 start_codon:yes stop_codon:yes gene_type:complete
MKISIFGLGYVGCVSAACLSKLDHDILGVDVDSSKVNLINNGLPTVKERGLDDLFNASKQNNEIRATSNYKEAISFSNVFFICVGTPISDKGLLDMSLIFEVLTKIAKKIKGKPKEKVIIVIRSTILPGSYNKMVKIISENSKMTHEQEFSLILNPEFLREGSAVHDYFNPPYTVISSYDKSSLEVIQEVYKKIDAPILKIDVSSAELIKFVNNSFHALKVSFANEIGRITKASNTDTEQLFKVFLSDNILNISKKYLKPGLPYGGSCLPKDLESLNGYAKSIGINTPLLKSINDSNKQHLNFVKNIIADKKLKKVGILGIAFKHGTDDVRESPMLEISRFLIKRKNTTLKIFDENIILDKLVGKNREILCNNYPDVKNSIVKSARKLLDDIDLLLVFNEPNDSSKIIQHLSDNTHLIDFSTGDMFNGHSLYEKAF